jgi:hypothetical protein
MAELNPRSIVERRLSEQDEFRWLRRIFRDFLRSRPLCGITSALCSVGLDATVISHVISATTIGTFGLVAGES